jgi:hypothetical protein
VATIFRLVEFETDRHLTLLLRDSKVFGDVAITYLVTPVAPDRSRLVVKLRIRHPGPTLLRPVVARAYPLGDLVMMRRQLLNLKALAEAGARGG